MEMKEIILPICKFILAAVLLIGSFYVLETYYIKPLRSSYVFCIVGIYIGLRLLEDVFQTSNSDGGERNEERKDTQEPP